MEELPEFKILEALKPGGQKEVFLVNCNGIKMIYKRGKCKSEKSLKRIIREVNILKDIDSPYFPKNNYFSYDENDMTFSILEEYIEGKTLADCSNQFNDEKDIAILILNIIEGMQLLWKKEIVHRDLKPDNIIISNKTSKPVIIDLGIAKSILDESLTRTVSPIGPCTIPYASPEQLLNQKDLISPKSDFFALGIIALELYNKHNPFDPVWVGNNNEIRENILGGIKRVEKSEKKNSQRFIDIFSKCLETESYKRYRTYVIFMEILKKFIEEDCNE